jgi:signal transduction histidine kinase
MQFTKKSPKQARLRPTFVSSLARVCLVLALGHFICVPLLSQVRPDYAPPVFISGILLMAVTFLCRYERFAFTLPYLCLGLLFGQTIYFCYQSRQLTHPLIMAFPVLTAMAAPILGKTRSYLAAACTMTLLFVFYFEFPNPHDRLSSQALLPFALVEILILISAFLSESLWSGMLAREEQLEEALKLIEKRNLEMEEWAKRLASAGTQISSGDLSAQIPKSPPDKIFRELTISMEQMQTKLNAYFSNLLLKDRLSSLGILASGVAHELNTPLTTMQFVLHTDERISAETKAKLQVEIERMSKITRDLLTFARPSPQESVDLNEIVKKTEPLWKSGDSRPIETAVELCEKAIPIRGVSNEVQQILFNLVHNALDATEGKSEGRVSVKTELREDGVAILSVSDNGCGISQENLNRILDPFFTTKSPGRGTGLGLFVVNQIVQKHDGVLTIESEEGKGTTVRILFLTQSTQDKKEAA